MEKLLRAIPATDQETPVQYVCIHPVVWKRLMRGETTDMLTEEPYEPTCLANDYEYESVLHEVCVALGWQGGTIHQVVEEVKRLRTAQG